MRDRFDYYTIVTMDAAESEAVGAAIARARGFGVRGEPKAVYWRLMSAGCWLLRLEFR